MSRRRWIHVKIWSSPSFLSLTPAKPCGEACLFHLLTGRHTTAIPGLFSAGQASLAESRRWPLAAWKKAFKEVEDGQMAVADWKAPLVYLPTALEHNPPTNPNMIRAWRDEWRLLPKCQLRDLAEKNMGTFIQTLGPSFVEAWLSVTGNVSPNIDRNVSPNNGSTVDANSPVVVSGNVLSHTRAGAQAPPPPSPVSVSDPTRAGVGFEPDPGWGPCPRGLFGQNTLDRVDPLNTNPSTSELRAAWAAVAQVKNMPTTGLRGKRMEANDDALGWFWAQAVEELAEGATLARLMVNWCAFVDRWRAAVPVRRFEDPQDVRDWLSPQSVHEAPGQAGSQWGDPTPEELQSGLGGTA